MTKFKKKMQQFVNNMNKCEGYYIYSEIGIHPFLRIELLKSYFHSLNSKSPDPGHETLYY